VKKKNREKFEQLERALATARADKIEALAEAAKLREEKAQIEAEAEELIATAAAVAEKLSKAEPIVASLRKALAHEDAPLVALEASALVEVLTGPVARKAATVTCGAGYAAQVVSVEGKLEGYSTRCWAEAGHEGPHGDEHGRSW